MAIFNGKLVVYQAVNLPTRPQMAIQILQLLFLAASLLAVIALFLMFPMATPKKERPKSGTPGNVFSKYHQTIFNPLVSQFPAHLFADGYHIYTSEVLKCHPRMVGLSIWFHRSAPRSIGLGRLGKRCLLVLDTHGQPHKMSCPHTSTRYCLFKCSLEHHKHKRLWPSDSHVH